jgi:hypothetical protein
VLPDSWPDDLPAPDGGIELKAPAAGPVRVYLLAYDATTPEALDAVLRKELQTAGWTAEPSRTGPEARRFKVQRDGRDLSISIRADGTRAILQVMQL